MKQCGINEESKPNCDQIELLEKILAEMPSEEEIQKNADIISHLQILLD